MHRKANPECAGKPHNFAKLTMPLYIVGAGRVVIEDLLLPPQPRVRFWARDMPQDEHGGDSGVDEAEKTHKAQGEHEMKSRYHLGAVGGDIDALVVWSYSCSSLHVVLWMGDVSSNLASCKSTPDVYVRTCLVKSHPRSFISPASATGLTLTWKIRQTLCALTARN